MKKFLRLFLCSLLFVAPLYGYDEFYPEALETLKDGKGWVETTFKSESKTAARNVFRIWFPYPAEQVWLVLIDVNAYKEQDDYSDSRTLDRHQFSMVEQKRPDSVKGFYELIGEQSFPSHHGRSKGGEWTSYVFQRFNLPWPLKDRWNVMRVRNDETNAHQARYRYEYKTVAGNFKELKGSWELLPVPEKPGWTEWRGDYRADPGIQYPQFLAKTVFKSSIRRAARHYMEMLDKKGVKRLE